MKIRFIVFLLMLASFISCEPIAQEINSTPIVGEHVLFLEPERTVEIIFYEDPSLSVPADTLVMSKDKSQRIFPKEFMPLSFSVKKNFLAFMVATQDADVAEVVFHEQNDIRR
ncbi:hypothetical protein [Penaeicola halotolerans]|uniref:hypothetical protein n=1 Tax=Penaeicola halotolerans TaxID=2793196 RepID=UPI001CF8E9D9|nr:hypothetical protein [Penaeicola halotolerans]